MVPFGFQVGGVQRLAERLRKEIGLLLAGVACTGALLAFFSVADEVVEGETHALDQAVLLWLHSPEGGPVGPVWLQQTGKDLTALGGYPILGLVTVLATAFLLMTGRKGAAALVLASIGGGALLSTLLKGVFARARPDLVPHAVDVFTASFPSGHAMMTAVAYLTLGALLMRVLRELRLKIFVMGAAVAITLVVGVSRVYLGVHWPTDVIAGWCVGFAWATLWWLVALVLQRRGRIDPEA